MITSIVILLAISLHLWLGEPHKVHPLTGFGTLANWLAKRLNLPNGDSRNQRLRGGAVLFFLLFTISLVGVLLIQLPTFGIVFEIGIVYLTIGYASLVEYAHGIQHALDDNDIKKAKLSASYLIGQDTALMDAEEISGFTTEAILENGNDAVVAALFWYVVAGVAGALTYRLTHTLDDMWKERTPHLEQFSWVANRFIFLLNWIPERLCGLTYVALGKRRKGFENWWHNAKEWKLSKGEITVTSGAYALNLRLGGDFIQKGLVRVRPFVRQGRTPTSEDILRALRLVYLTTWSWVGIVLVGDLLFG